MFSRENDFDPQEVFLRLQDFLIDQVVAQNHILILIFLRSRMALFGSGRNPEAGILKTLSQLTEL